MAVAKLAHNCQVSLTDGDSQAIDLLQQNLSNLDNQLDAATIQATFLLWSAGIDQSHEFCRWCRKTWSWPDTDNVAFDYILAGDVLYKDELPPLFFAAVRSLLALNGVLFLCHVPRANVGHDEVLKAAAMAGFSCVHETVSDNTALVAEGCSIDDLNRARVYKLHVDGAVTCEDHKARNGR
jgi:hypothetical protein